ncbi:MAG: hypothetical protein WC484_01965 [Candidatus Omnitrophota bacterium]
MKTNEILIAELRHQRDLLNNLVGQLEMKRVLTVEDYSYCESCADEISKRMKEIRHAALDKMIQGAPWFQMTLR